MAIGPVEYIIVGFPGNKFTGEIAPELIALVESGTVKVLDLDFHRQRRRRATSWPSRSTSSTR